MERGREQESRAEDPEQGPLRIEVREHGSGHDREHEQPGQVPGRHRPRQNGLDDGECPLVRAPMFRVGDQPGPERRARLGIGKMEEDQHARTRRQQTHPIAVDERRQSGDGRKLRKRREGQRGAHRPRRPSPRHGARPGHVGIAAAGNRIGVGRVRRLLRGSGRASRQGQEDQGREQKKTEGLEVSAPGRLDHQQRRPGEQNEGRGNRAAGPAGHLRQQHAGRQVGQRPQCLEPEHRPARERARREHHLGEGRVDGGDGRIVDAPMPGGSNRFEFRRIRRVQIGVDPLQLNVPVPEIPVDVVGQKWNAGE